MRKIKEIIEEIELLGKTNFAYLDLRNELGQRPTSYKIFCGIHKFLDCCSDKKERKIRIAREFVEVGVKNCKNSDDLVYLAFLAYKRDLKDVEWAREVIRNGMIKFNSKDDYLNFARVVEDESAINDKEWASEIYASVANELKDVDDMISLAYSTLNGGIKSLAKDILHRAAKSVETVEQISRIIDLIGTRKNELNDTELVDKLLNLPLAKCQNLSDAILLIKALSRFYKPKAFEYFNVVRKFVNNGFDISKAIYVAGNSLVLNDKKLAIEILTEVLESDYSFDEWYSILNAVKSDIGDENLTNMILQKCVDAIKQDDLNYSFDKWYSILNAVKFDIGDENLTNMILQKCVDAIKQDDVNRRKKFNLLSDFARDIMNDIKLSTELNKQSK